MLFCILKSVIALSKTPPPLYLPLLGGDENVTGGFALCWPIKYYPLLLTGGGRTIWCAGEVQNGHRRNLNATASVSPPVRGRRVIFL